MKPDTPTGQKCGICFKELVAVNIKGTDTWVLACSCPGHTREEELAAALQPERQHVKFTVRGKN